MPGPPSLKQLPRWVDSRKFAHQDVELEGQIPEGSLPRLSNAVSHIDTPVYAKLHFSLDESGYRTVTGPLRVTISAVCQRCMKDTQLEIASALAVGIVTSDEQSKLLPRSLEPWQVNREEAEADLYAVIEDELLLGLPMAVYHDYQCIDEELYSAGDLPEASEEESRPNPFQVLEQLKGRNKK